MKKSTPCESTNETPIFFGHQLPNESTMGFTLNNPIVIRSGNYIDAEVTVTTTFLSVYDTVAWDVIDNHIETVNGKKIDCYEILVSDWNDITKEAFTVMFYFDISDCS